MSMQCHLAHPQSYKTPISAGAFVDFTAWSDECRPHGMTVHPLETAREGMY